ncbi:MAG TPA: SRPBCC family protein [bacterium]|nr:SRPBCC family protein [bacterium]
MVVEAHRILRATREHVFAFVAHPEHLPRYGAPLWLAADLDDRRGAEPLITLRGYFAGLPVEAVIRGASRAPQSVDVAQVRGTLRGFSQRFTIESGDDGTVLSCRVEADPGIPMLSDEAAKHFLTQYVERMLDRLRLTAERRAPSRRPARPSAKEAAETETGDLAVQDGIPAAEQAEPGRAPAEPAAADAAPTPATVPELTGTPQAPRPRQRPFPPRRSRPQRPGPPQPARSPQHASEAGTPAAEAAMSDQTGPADAAAGGQGRRRRRRRRRRGRGASGSGPAGGAPSTGPAGNSSL